MKKVFVTYFFVSINLLCFSQWTNVPNNFQSLNPSLEKNDIIMTGNGIGFQKLISQSSSSNNNSVYLYKTNNDWQTVTVITAANSNSTCCSVKMDFINDSVGVRILTSNGIDSISKTIDGGSTWAHWFTSSNILNIQFLDDSTLFYANTNSAGHIMVNRIINQDWKVIYTASNTFTFLSGNGIHFLDSINGYILSVDPSQSIAPNILKKTTNAGLTWYDVFPQSGTQVSCIKFQNATTGYFGNNSGSIYKTTDSGITWRLIQTPLSANVNDIEFGTNNSIFASSFNGMLIKSIDNGASWTTEQVGTSKNLIDIHTIENSSIVYVNTNDGDVYKNDLLTELESIKKENNTVSIFPNPSQEFINIKSNDEIKISTLFNSNGQVILESTQSNIDVSSLSSGLYFIKVETLSSPFILKFIKE